MADESFIHLVDGYLEGKLDKNDLKRFLEMIEASPENRELLARNAVISRLIHASRRNPVSAEQIIMALPRHGDTAKLIIDQIRDSEEEADQSDKARIMIRKASLSGRKQPSRKNGFQSRPDKIPGIVYFFRTVTALAACAMVVFGIWKFVYQPANALGPCLATLDSSGEVMIKRGEQQMRASQNTMLYSGDTIYVGPQAFAVARYNNENTFLKLQEWSVMKIENAGGAKKLSLQGGAIVAGVAPQPEGLPMTIATPRACATVIGTHFIIKSSAASTVLEVTSGKVRIARGLDNSTADISTGNKIEINDTSPLSVQQMPSPVIGHLGDKQLADMFQTMTTAKAWGINTLTFNVTSLDPSAMPAGLGAAIAAAHKAGARFYAKLDIPKDIGSSYNSFMPGAKSRLSQLAATYNFDGIYVTRPPELTDDNQFRRILDDVYLSVNKACITIDTGMQREVSTNDTWFIGY